MKLKENKLERLNRVLVKDKKAYYTDLESFVVVDSDLENGIYDFENFFECPKLSENQDDFPLFPDFKARASVKVTKEELKTLKEHTSKDGIRIHLCGIYFGKGELVGCDGYTLRTIKKDIDENSILTNGIVDLILSNIKSKQEVEIEIGEDFFKIDTKNGIIFGRKLKREYPKYQAAMPSKTDKVITINTLPKLSELKVVLDKACRVKLISENGKIFLITPMAAYNNFEIGEGDIKDPIYFNLKLLHKIVKEKTELLYNDALSPFLVKYRNKDEVLTGEGIVMPLR